MLNNIPSFYGHMHRLDLKKKKRYFCCSDSYPYGNVLVSGCIWYTASTVRIVFLHSTWILTVFCKQSVHRTKDSLECCLCVNEFCLKRRLVPTSNPEFISRLNLSFNSCYVLEFALFHVLIFTMLRDNS